MPADTATETWPTVAELEAVGESLSCTDEAVEVLRRRLVQRLVDLDVTPPFRDEAPHPTLADIGALSWFVEYAEMHVSSMQEHVHTIRRVRDEVAGYLPDAGGESDAS